MNIRNAPKEEVEAVIGAARICEISNIVCTNTTQGTKVTTVNADNNAVPMEIPVDTEAPNINGYHVDNLVKEYYCFHADFPQYKTKSTNGVPDIHLKKKISRSSLGLRTRPKQLAADFPSSPIKRSRPPDQLPA